MALDFRALLAELRQESTGLVSCLSRLQVEDWDQPTPAVGWDIRDQVSHLAYFDDTAVLAMTDPQAFERLAERLTSGGSDFPDRIAAEYRSLSGEALLSWFVESRETLLDTFSRENARRRVPWFGPEMSIASSATARLMETWAHGQDIYDTVGVPHPPCSGLRSIAHLGVRTFEFTYRLHNRAVPTDGVRVELRSPDDELWAWGPSEALNRVTGDAEDFVRVVTQRRHWTETDLHATGSVASEWLEIAQAFAGEPGRGRSVSH